jgi:hypothetical protein
VWTGGLHGQRSLSWPKADYAPFFDQIAHILVNHSPFMSWAFPRGLFADFGLEFDEELDVCEDWDMILRASLLVGVDDIPALTSIYRQWKGGVSSYTVHSSEIWQRSEKRVIDRLNESIVVMPPGSVGEVRDLLRVYNRHAAEELDLMSNSVSWRVTIPLRVVKNRAIRVRGTLLHWNNILKARLRGEIFTTGR